MRSKNTSLAEVAAYESEEQSKPTLHGRRYALKKDPFLEVRCGSAQDIVNNAFKIIANKPLETLNAPFAQAYEVRDVREEIDYKHADDDLYALVLSNRKPARLKTINRLCGADVPYFANLHAHQIIPFSGAKGGTRLALVLSRPKGEPLSALLHRTGALPEREIETAVIRPMHEAIAAIQDRQSMHGCVNPDTIFIDKNGTPTLGQCFTEYCGYSQDPLFECSLRAVGLIFVGFYFRFAAQHAGNHGA